MSAIFAAIGASPLFRKAVVILGLVLAVLLALAGFRRSAERRGRLIERETNRVEREKANKRIEEVKRKMGDVPRPDDSTVRDRLSDGTF